MSLDLKNPDGLAAVRQLVTCADILIEVDGVVPPALQPQHGRPPHRPDARHREGEVLGDGGFSPETIEAQEGAGAI